MERRLRQWWSAAVASEDVRTCAMVVLAALFGAACSYALTSSLDLSGYTERDL